MSEQMDRITQAVDEARIADLATLSRLQYDRVRKDEAKALGIQLKTLDDLIVARRRATGEAALKFADPEPWPETVDGAALLDRIRGEIEKFIVLPPHGSTSIALWALHTWCADSFFISPFLFLRSPQKRCGKTTLMMLLAEFVRRKLLATNATPAALFRSIEEYRPTLLLDEADTWMRENEELRGILNGGHSRLTAQVLRTVGEQHEVRVFSTFCPKAFSGIGRLVDTLEDRSIIVEIKRKRPEDGVRRLRQDRLDGLEIRRQSRRWSDDHAETLRTADPEVPMALNDRAADNWRALLAIADAAGSRWPSEARVAAVALAGQTDDEATGAQLLADIRALFERQPENQAHDRSIESAALVAALGTMEDRPWSEWRQGKPITAPQLARLLKPFDIRPRTVRTGYQTAKGYLRSEFADTFARYLPPALQAVTPSQPHEFSFDTGTSTRDSESEAGRHIPSHSGTLVCPVTVECDGVTDRPGVGVAYGNGAKPGEYSPCDGVTDKQGKGDDRAVDLPIIDQEAV